nr:PREDICTED: doublecortin domain-containing protein 2C [Struthio camelus australis]
MGMYVFIAPDFPNDLGSRGIPEGQLVMCAHLGSGAQLLHLCIKGSLLKPNKRHFSDGNVTQMHDVITHVKLSIAPDGGTNGMSPGAFLRAQLTKSRGMRNFNGYRCYIEIGIKKQQGKRKEVMIKPVVHSTIRVPSRWQCIYNKPRHINVFTNGEMIKPPIKFIIPRFTLKNWNCVLALINEKMLLRSGGVHRLYTLDGRAVHSSDGLEDNHFYVAVGRENFKPLPYWRSPRVPSEVRCLYGESRASSRRSKKKKARHQVSLQQTNQEKKFKEQKKYKMTKMCK